jgi:hypothetical protein
MDETVRAEGKNFQLIQGAQLAITSDLKLVEKADATRIENMQAYGRRLGQILLDMESGEAVPAMLNIAHRQYQIKIDNPLQLLMFRLKFIESTAIKNDFWGLDLDLKTEVGYMEIGDKLAVAIVPGEMEPALLYGGGLTRENAYSGEDWNYTPMKTTVGERETLVFGLANDQSGYILPPNDINNFVLFGNEEINIASSESAPKLLENFSALVENTKKSAK